MITNIQRPTAHAAPAKAQAAHEVVRALKAGETHLENGQQICRHSLAGSSVCYHLTEWARCTLARGNQLPWRV